MRKFHFYFYLITLNIVSVYCSDTKLQQSFKKIMHLIEIFRKELIEHPFDMPKKTMGAYETTINNYLDSAFDSLEQSQINDILEFILKLKLEIIAIIQTEYNEEKKSYPKGSRIIEKTVNVIKSSKLSSEEKEKKLRNVRINWKNISETIETRLNWMIQDIEARIINWKKIKYPDVDDISIQNEIQRIIKDLQLVEKFHKFSIKSCIYGLQILNEEDYYIEILMDSIEDDIHNSSLPTGEKITLLAQAESVYKNKDSRWIAITCVRENVEKKKYKTPEDAWIDIKEVENQIKYKMATYPTRNKTYTDKKLNQELNNLYKEAKKQYPMSFKIWWKYLSSWQKGIVIMDMTSTGLCAITNIIAVFTPTKKF